MLGEHGMLVLLDVHNMRAGEWPERGWPATASGDAAEAAEELGFVWNGLAERLCETERC